MHTRALCVTPMADIRVLPPEAKQFLSGYRAALNDVQTCADLREAMSLKLSALLIDLRGDADDMERGARAGHFKRRRSKAPDLFTAAE